MEYRPLGSTGIRVSEVGFGCGNVGGLIIRGDHDTRVGAMRQALDLGFTYFDTAASYGSGVSEEHLGELLEELRPQVTVATKFTVPHGELSDIHGAVFRSLEASLKRLRRDRVDVLQLHNRIGPSDSAGERELSVEHVLGKGGVADALDEARSQGLAGHVGFTALGDTGSIHQVVGSGRFGLLQAYYNILNPSAGQAVPPGFATQDFACLIDRASQQGMGVVVIRVMSAGALGGEEARQGLASPGPGGVLSPGSSYDEDTRRAQALRDAIKEPQEDLPGVAIRFALMNPAVSTVLVGMSNLGHIETDAASSGKGPLPPQVMDRLPALWASDFRDGTS